VARRVRAGEWLIALSLSGSICGHAARPLVTDDARIVDPKACQLETWTRSNRDSTEYWALPGCNFTGNLELTFGGARTNDASGTYTSDVQAQAKTLFKSLESNGWGWGLAVGNLRHPPASGPAGDFYAYIPVSFSFADDAFVLHTNVGALRTKEERDYRLTWGVGSETQITAMTLVVAEIFGQDANRPSYQLGLRHWLVRNRVQVDATYGNRTGSGDRDRWFSLGLRLLTPAFLP
jgi:hypothetical protein